MKKILALTAIAAMIAGTANAIPSVTIADNNGNSASASDASGIVTYSGALGNWNINIDTGVGGPPAPTGGTASHPTLDLGGQNNFSQTAQGPLVGNVLTITFTDDNLGPISSAFKYIVTGFTHANMTAVFNLLVNGVVVDTVNGFSGLDNVNLTAGAGSTVSLQAVLTATGNTAFTSFDTAVSPAPDAGMTLAMLGAGLAGLVVFARSRKTA